MSFSELLSALHRYGSWVPDLAVATLVLVLAVGLALIAHRFAMRAAKRLVPAESTYLKSLIEATHALTRFALAIIAVAVVLPVTPLGVEARATVAHVLFVAFIVLLGWSASVAITLATNFYLWRSNIAERSDALARKHVTQVRVLRRVTATLVVVVTVAAALMTFDSVKQYGVSLIASAGAAGIIVGLALRPLLTNLFAGIQIAITQPIRINDAVIVENEWGWIEEITGTYVVIKLWDWRRLVVPLSYFLEKPFQNWTRQTTDLIGTVLLWVDYTVPVAPIRARLEQIVKETALWDGQVVNLQVVDSSDRAVQLRALVSARSSPETWDLRCEVREKLVEFLQQNHPGALPKQRAEVVEFGRHPAAAASS